MQQVLELIGVSKLYEAGFAALDAVSFSMETGEFLAVMGPSGSGKSTLLNLIAGLDRPTHGRVVLEGVDLAGRSEGALAQYRRDHIGIIFQFFHLLHNLSVLDNVLLPAQLAGTDSHRAEERARDLLEQLQMADKSTQYPGKLSGGERQRVAIARALINSPALLLADEPTGALDSRNGMQVMDMLTDLNRAGQTILWVTHDPNLAAQYASRVLGLRDGQVTQDSRVSRSPINLTDEARRRLDEVAQ